MPIRFCSIASGSRGNCHIVDYQGTTVMVDCGISVKEIESRLAERGMHPLDIDAVLITHEHADHSGHAGKFSRRYNVPVYLTVGTLNHCKDKRFYRKRCIDPDQAFEIKDLAVQAFPVSHDAREPCHFHFTAENKKVAILTDTGQITDHILQQLNHCNGLMIECNYDADMLANGPYPRRLKKRVASKYGHLDNLQAAELLQQLELDNIQHIVAMHISEKNNTPSKALDALNLAAPENHIIAANQDGGIDWLSL